MGEIDQQNVMLVESNPTDWNESYPNERTLILMIEKWPNFLRTFLVHEWNNWMTIHDVSRWI